MPMPQVSDYGLSPSFMGEGKISANKYRTLTHQPPEMLMPNAVGSTCAGDVYAFGVLLWQVRR